MESLGACLEKEPVEPTYEQPPVDKPKLVETPKDEPKAEEEETEEEEEAGKPKKKNLERSQWLRLQSHLQPLNAFHGQSGLVCQI